MDKLPAKMDNNRRFSLPMQKRYTVFVSSTFCDLEAERNAVIAAILSLGHIPIGMEMFSAGSRPAWDTIRQSIDQADYYVVIVAQKYGTLSGKISFTEREYDYAIERRIPALPFLLHEDAVWSQKAFEKTATNKRSLEMFRNKLKQNHVVSFWKDSEQLGLQVTAALAKAFNQEPRPGWIRGDQIPGPELASEIARLSAQNDELRAQVAEAGKVNFEVLAAEYALGVPYSSIRKTPVESSTGTPKSYFAAYLYISHCGPQLVMPFHRMRGEIEFGNGEVLPFGNFGARSKCTAITVDKSEIRISSSGGVTVTGVAPLPVGAATASSATLRITLPLVAPRAIVLSAMRTEHAGSLSYADPAVRFEDVIPRQSSPAMPIATRPSRRWSRMDGLL